MTLKHRPRAGYTILAINNEPFTSHAGLTANEVAFGIAAITSALKRLRPPGLDVPDDRKAAHAECVAALEAVHDALSDLLNDTDCIVLVHRD